ncbi:unnamed protein product, partial [Didymodactylos carnosus]
SLIFSIIDLFHGKPSQLHYNELNGGLKIENPLWPSSGKGFWVGLILMATGVIGILASHERTVSCIIAFAILSTVSAILSFYMMITCIIPVQYDVTRTNSKTRSEADRIELIMNSLLIAAGVLGSIVGGLASIFSYKFAGWCSNQRVIGGYAQMPQQAMPPRSPYLPGSRYYPPQQHMTFPPNIAATDHILISQSWNRPSVNDRQSIDDALPHLIQKHQQLFFEQQQPSNPNTIDDIGIQVEKQDEVQRASTLPNERSSPTRNKSDANNKHPTNEQLYSTSYNRKTNQSTDTQISIKFIDLHAVYEIIDQSYSKVRNWYLLISQTKLDLDFIMSVNDYLDRLKASVYKDLIRKETLHRNGNNHSKALVALLRCMCKISYEQALEVTSDLTASKRAVLYTMTAIEHILQENFPAKKPLLNYILNEYISMWLHENLRVIQEDFTVIAENATKNNFLSLCICLFHKLDSCCHLNWQRLQMMQNFRLINFQNLMKPLGVKLDQQPEFLSQLGGIQEHTMKYSDIPQTQLYIYRTEQEIISLNDIQQTFRKCVAKGILDDRVSEEVLAIDTLSQMSVRPPSIKTDIVPHILMHPTEVAQQMTIQRTSTLPLKSNDDVQRKLRLTPKGSVSEKNHGIESETLKQELTEPDTNVEKLVTKNLNTFLFSSQTPFQSVQQQIETKQPSLEVADLESPQKQFTFDTENSLPQQQQTKTLAPRSTSKKDKSGSRTSQSMYLPVTDERNQYRLTFGEMLPNRNTYPTNEIICWQPSVPPPARMASSQEQLKLIQTSPKKQQLSGEDTARLTVLNEKLIKESLALQQHQLGTVVNGEKDKFDVDLMSYDNLGELTRLSGSFIKVHLAQQLQEMRKNKENLPLRYYRINDKWISEGIIFVLIFLRASPLAVFVPPEEQLEILIKLQPEQMTAEDMNRLILMNDKLLKSYLLLQQQEQAQIKLSTLKTSSLAVVDNAQLKKLKNSTLQSSSRSEGREAILNELILLTHINDLDNRSSLVDEIMIRKYLNKEKQEDSFECQRSLSSLSTRSTQTTSSAREKQLELDRNLSSLSKMSKPDTEEQDTSSTIQVDSENKPNISQISITTQFVKPAPSAPTTEVKLLQEKQHTSIDTNKTLVQDNIIHEKPFSETSLSTKSKGMSDRCSKSIRGSSDSDERTTRDLKRTLSPKQNSGKPLQSATTSSTLNLELNALIDFLKNLMQQQISHRWQQSQQMRDPRRIPQSTLLERCLTGETGQLKDLYHDLNSLDVNDPTFIAAFTRALRKELEDAHLMTNYDRSEYGVIAESRIGKLPFETQTALKLSTNVTAFTCQDEKIVYDGKIDYDCVIVEVIHDPSRCLPNPDYCHPSKRKKIMSIHQT